MFILVLLVSKYRLEFVSLFYELKQKNKSDIINLTLKMIIIYRILEELLKKE